MAKRTWRQTDGRLRVAEKLGEEISDLHNQATLPVDPFSIATSEQPFLRILADDFGDVFDGQLEYHRKQNRFLLFLNTKYDARLDAGEHHCRTRYSLGHELGHYFLESHRAYLMGGGKPHASASECQSDEIMEREADAFSAGLLMPSNLARPIINQTEPSFDRIVETADTFKTSIVSTAIRTIRLSDFPCGIVGIKKGCIAWMFPSNALINAGCYPAERGRTISGNAAQQWEEFRINAADRFSADGDVQGWCRTYDREDLDEIILREEYFPVPVMQTLLVLLTIDEDDLPTGDEDD